MWPKAAEELEQPSDAPENHDEAEETTMDALDPVAADKELPAQQDPDESDEAGPIVKGRLNPFEGSTDTESKAEEQQSLADPDSVAFVSEESPFVGLLGAALKVDTATSTPKKVKESDLRNLSRKDLQT